jgi:hypothetical protein
MIPEPEHLRAEAEELQRRARTLRRLNEHATSAMICAALVGVGELPCDPESRMHAALNAAWYVSFGSGLLLHITWVMLVSRWSRP